MEDPQRLAAAPDDDMLPSNLPLPHLPVVRYALTFRAIEPVTLPPLAAALWRGVLGRALKQMADGEAPAPLGLPAARAATLYRDLFETPPPPDAAKMRRYTSVPHPYALMSEDGGARLAVGEETRLALTLVGRANADLPGIVAGFRRAAETGLGKARSRMVLDQVDAIWREGEPLPVYRSGGSVVVPTAESPAVPPMPRFIEVELLSPLRLLRQGRLVGADLFQARDMLGYLVRRVSMLSYFHTDCPHETDFRHLKELASRLHIVERNLAWWDQHRWSATRQEEIDMGGLTGWFVLDLREATPLWPYLWLGPWIHAGKGATMGQGAVALRPA